MIVQIEDNRNAYDLGKCITKACETRAYALMLEESAVEKSLTRVLSSLIPQSWLTYIPNMLLFSPSNLAD